LSIVWVTVSNALNHEMKRGKVLYLEITIWPCLSIFSETLVISCVSFFYSSFFFFLKGVEGGLSQ
jgi:hypothetical protein